MIRIHREGRRIVLVSVVTLFSTGLLFYLLLPLNIFLSILPLQVIILLLILRFFRIPKRQFIPETDAIVAPADGTVVNIEEVTESEYFKEKRKLVSIFMSIHNVHINWYPVSGTITYYKYHPGKYLLARHPKSSELNERTSIVIQNPSTTLLVRQIAGYVARRIVCYAGENIAVRQAEELGFIKFGSRLDVYLPLNSKITVKIGDHTVGGVTVLAE
ncbi:phosphatidylserine decarboxylase family protein [Bacteroidota bacterium]